MKKTKKPETLIKQCFWLLTVLSKYVPGEIRTPDRRLRRALLYPAELLGHVVM